MSKVLRFFEYNESKKTEKIEDKKTEKVDSKPVDEKEICISFKVKNKDSHYKVTDAAINGKKELERAIKTGYVPCGDGCDYKLTADEIQQLKDGKYDTFKPSKEVK